MKKTIIYGVISIAIGYYMGNIIFSNRTIFSHNDNNEKYYFLKEGTYYDKNILKDNQNNLRQKLIEKDKDKITIYVAITKNLEVAERIMNIYEENNINLSIVERYNTSEYLKSNIEQFDLLILSSKDNDEVLKIEDVVLACYEETIKSNNDSLI